MVRCPSDKEYGQWKLALESQTADNVKATYVRPLLSCPPHSQKVCVVVVVSVKWISLAIKKMIFFSPYRFICWFSPFHFYVCLCVLCYLWLSLSAPLIIVWKLKISSLRKVSIGKEICKRKTTSKYFFVVLNLCKIQSFLCVSPNFPTLTYFSIMLIWNFILEGDIDRHRK